MRSLVAAFRGQTRNTTKTPVPYASRYAATGTGSLLTPSGAENQIRAAGANSTLFAIIDAYATAIAGVDWHLYRQLPPGAQEHAQRPLVPAHAALDLWTNPTGPGGFYSQPRLVKSFTQHKELVGEGIVVVVKIGSLPYELWPVRPDRMEPVPDAEKFLLGWIYHGPDGQLVPLGVDQVVQMVQTPCPWDAYRGMGAVQTILMDLYGDAAAAEWHKNFFKNSARPDGVIEVPVALSETEFEDFQQRWRETHQGVNNAFRVAMLEHGSKWVSTSYSPHDMRFDELRAASHERIRGAFRMPRTILGEGENLNRATAEAQLFLFASGHAVPRLNDIKREFLNYRLLPMYGGTGTGVEFDFVNPTPEDKEAKDRNMVAQATAYEKYVASGVEGDDPEMLRHLGLPRMRVAPRPAPAPPAEEGEPPAGKPKALPAAHTSNGHHRVTLAFGRQPRRPALPRAAGAAADEDAPDLSGVREDLETALDALEAAWEPIQDRWVDALVDQVEAAAASGKFDSLDVGDTGEAADVIRAALAGMAETARDRAVKEVAEQGVTVEPPELDEAVKALGIPEISDFGGELVKVARSLAKRLGGILAGMAGDVAEQLWRPGVKAGELAARVRESLAPTLKRGWRTREERFGGALRRATNTARLTVQGAALKARRGGKIVATEVLDEATCTREKGETAPRCREIDGTAYDTPAEAWADYGAGVYRLCKGRWRCRGTTVVRWPKGGD